MKKYHLFFMCSVLLSPCLFIFGMEKKSEKSTPQKKDILKVLEQNDPNKILLPPDELNFYTPELFMKKLNLPEEKLKTILNNYCTHTKRIFNNAIKPKPREKRGELVDATEKANEKEKTPTDPKKVLEFLSTPYDKNNKELKYEEFKQLKDTFFIFEGCYSIDTGVNLNNLDIDPTQNQMIVSVCIIQQIKKNVWQRLKKLTPKR